MTTRDMRCDVCDRPVPGPAGGPVPAGTGGVRFAYHPGNLRLRDDSGLVCERCWDETWQRTATTRRMCAVCGEPVTHEGSLHVRRLGDPETRQLCSPHAADFLNRLRTVEPKLDRATFHLPLPEFASGGPD